ncbi:FAD-dependent oxidoreductase [Candidatus Omnitrophota bacterium]
MKVAIIGAGLSGCTIGRLLKDKGHDVTVFEKEKTIGGLCATATHKGRAYQLFGPHNFHTDNATVRRFICRFTEFNDYVHHKGICVNGKVLPYPVSYETINELPERVQILRELSRRPANIDMENFERCVISIIGRTLYKKFIENYTGKFWGISPRKIEADWVQKRIEIRQDNSLGYFKDEWQGLPVYGYTNMFERMMQGITVHCGVEIKDYGDLKYDLIISTTPIDELFHFKFGRLKYRGVRFTVNFDDGVWEDKKYGCINYPNNDVPYIRKSNYSIAYQDNSSGPYIVGYDFPDAKSRMYPFYTIENKKILNKYLGHLIKIKNLVSIGRLGLFRYYDMDEAIGWCLDNAENVERYQDLSFQERARLLNL